MENLKKQAKGVKIIRHGNFPSIGRRVRTTSNFQHRCSHSSSTDLNLRQIKNPVQRQCRDILHRRSWSCSAQKNLNRRPSACPIHKPVKPCGRPQDHPSPVWGDAIGGGVDIDIVPRGPVHCVDLDIVTFQGNIPPVRQNPCHPAPQVGAVWPDISHTQAVRR